MHRGLLRRRGPAVDADVLALDRVGAPHRAVLLRVGQPARAVDVHRHVLGHLPGQPLVQRLSLALAGDGELVVVQGVGAMGGE